MTLILNTDDRRVYRLGGMVAEITLSRRRSWRWAVRSGAATVGQGETHSLSLARTLCERLMEEGAAPVVKIGEGASRKH